MKSKRVHICFSLSGELLQKLVPLLCPDQPGLPPGGIQGRLMETAEFAKGAWEGGERLALPSLPVAILRFRCSGCGWGSKRAGTILL